MTTVVTTVVMGTVAVGGEMVCSDNNLLYSYVHENRSVLTHQEQIHLASNFFFNLLKAYETVHTSSSMMLMQQKKRFFYPC